MVYIKRNYLIIIIIEGKIKLYRKRRIIKIMIQIIIVLKIIIF